MTGASGRTRNPEAGPRSGLVNHPTTPTWYRGETTAGRWLGGEVVLASWIVTHHLAR
jgi:hypothetical protein